MHINWKIPQGQACSSQTIRGGNKNHLLSKQEKCNWRKGVDRDNTMTLSTKTMTYSKEPLHILTKSIFLYNAQVITGFQRTQERKYLMHQLTKKRRQRANQTCQRTNIVTGKSPGIGVSYFQHILSGKLSLGNKPQK